MTDGIAQHDETESAAFIARIFRPFQQFVEAVSAGGLLLMVSAAVGLACANSRLGSAYFALWDWSVTIGPAGYALTKTVSHWINDGLMVLFFLLVGLEIKREIFVGELSSVRHAALPIAAALGGMIVPAAIYAPLNAGSAGARGWGIPMATDIAFALGVLSLLGSRIPSGLRLFLAALAHCRRHRCGPRQSDRRVRDSGALCLRECWRAILCRDLRDPVVARLPRCGAGVVGKVTGIVVAARLAARRGVAALPPELTWRSVFGVAWLGGIGFTMSIFVATLAFGSGPLLDSAKLGILAGSVVAAYVGTVTLWKLPPPLEGKSSR